jgi:hypothetical protein
MKHMNLLLRYNLQFFAADDGTGAGGSNSNDDGDDNQDDDQDDKGSDDKSKKSEKKTYTQEEIDNIITERLKRERKKQQAKEQSKDDKQGDKGSDDKSKEDVTSKKLSDLEMKVLCYDHDISKEYVKEAIALAKAYVDEDTDMDEALELVTKKFPQFVKGADSKKKKSDKEDDGEDEDETDNKKAWGQRQKGSKQKDPSEMTYEEYKKYRQGK